jgi:hypothetical protein
LHNENYEKSKELKYTGHKIIFKLEVCHHSKVGREDGKGKGEARCYIHYQLVVAPSLPVP